MQKLFTDFNNTTAQQWKEQLIKDLKGIDFDTLISHTNEGIDIQPFYTSEAGVKNQDPIFKHNDWAIVERILVSDEKAANTQALHALSNGASGLEFIISQSCNYDVLLNGILLEHIYTYFQLPINLIVNLNEALAKINKGNHCYVKTDIIAHYCEFGHWLSNQHDDFSRLKNNSKITIDGSLYQEAGSNAVNELSFIVAHLNEYLNYYSENDLLNQLKKIHVSVSIGGSFFMELAKLRALRQLFEFLLKQYDVNALIHLHGITTSINKSELDSYNNLLRSTTEAMSASIGGCDSIVTLPFDERFNVPSNFSLRMARNQQLILKEESYLNKVADMAAGSYYIEKLTHELSHKAWDAFKKIEETGGFIEGLNNNLIQSIIKNDADTLKQQFTNGTMVLVGVNKFKNPTESVLVKEKSAKPKSENMLIAPIEKITLG